MKLRVNEDDLAGKYGLVFENWSIFLWMYPAYRRWGFHSHDPWTRVFTCGMFFAVAKWEDRPLQ